jgi:hypothetical protein
MVSDLVFYPLALVLLVWLFVMLVLVWPSGYGAAWHSPAKPSKTTRQRTRDPKPFAGLTRKPYYEACEQRTEPRRQASPRHNYLYLGAEVTRLTLSVLA